MARRDDTDEFKPQRSERRRVPLWIGAAGPSGSGKTLSMLRLGEGIRRVVGGRMAVIDTENGRSLHYAPPPGQKPIPGRTFDFDWYDFKPPYNPLRFLHAWESAVKHGATVIVTDAMTHEHNGIGGFLEMHAAETQRIAGDDWKKAERVKMLCWQKPKSERLAAKNGALQLQAHFLFGFRAREKLKLVKGGEPEKLGLMPDGGEEWLYEMTAQCLLRPRANGVPTWRSDETGEKLMMKLPEQFKHLLTSGEPLSEDMGEAMAKWADGGAITAYDEVASLVGSADAAGLEALAKRAQAVSSKMNRTEVEGLKAAFAARRAELATPGRGGAQDAPQPTRAASAPIATDTPDGEPPLGVLEEDQ